MESSKVKTRIIIPADTVFDFAGDGLDGGRGKLRVDAGAGFGFNEWGRLILNLLENGGLGYVNDKLCINACEMASRIAGTGLQVQDCKLAVNFCDIVDCGLKMTEDGKFAVDLEKLAGKGLKVVECELQVNFAEVALVADARIDADAQIDPTKTLVLPYIIDNEFRYKPNGYGYNCGLEIVKNFSTMTFYKNCKNRVVAVEQGEIQQSVQDFEFGCGVVQNVAARTETPAVPNFYAN